MENDSKLRHKLSNIVHVLQSANVNDYEQADLKGVVKYTFNFFGDVCCPKWDFEKLTNGIVWMELWHCVNGAVPVSWLFTGVHQYVCEAASGKSLSQSLKSFWNIYGVIEIYLTKFILWLLRSYPVQLAASWCSQISYM